MKKYRVVLANSAGDLSSDVVSTDKINATIVKIINDLPLYAGDSIRIEECDETD